MPDRLQIMVAAPMDGATGWWLGNAFKDLGAVVAHYPYRQYAIQHGMERMNEDFAQAMQEADLTVILKGEWILPKVVRAVVRGGYRVAVWHLDPWAAQLDHSASLGREANWMFTIANGLVPWYRKFGVDARWLLEACDPSTHYVNRHSNEPKYPIGFVGTIGGVPGREEWLTRVRKEFGTDLHLFGSQPGRLAGPQHHGRAEESIGLKGDKGLAWIVAHTRVNLGRDRRPDLERSYGARLFRTLAAGGYLLTNDTLGVHEDFRGCVGVYRSDEECIERIRWALTRPQEAQRIARRGQKMVLSKHTFRHRAMELLSVAGLKPGASG